MNDGTPIPGAKTEYALVSETVGGRVFFGVAVSLTESGETERVVLRELTSDRGLALAILDAMRRGYVTPCAAEGVAQDMLAEDAVRRAEGKR